MPRPSPAEHDVAVVWHAQGEHHVPEDDRWMSPREAQRSALMRYPKRRNDFRLGRWTAKQTLVGALGLDAAVELPRLEVRNAFDGAPEAYVADQPAPVTIAMTDRAGWGVCAVIGGPVRLGVDLELVERRSDTFVASYLTPAEQHVVTAAGDLEQRYLLANLFWSAKESALKVLRTGLRRDTRSVEVRLVGDDATDGWFPLVVHAEEGHDFPGWWRRFGPFLLTLAAAAETPPPRPLSRPPHLEGAEPTHTWMGQPRR